MSQWREIAKEDVELSNDKQTIDVLIGSDYNGNNYIEIPIEYIIEILQKGDFEL